MKFELTKKRIRNSLIAIIIIRTIALVWLDGHTYWTFDEPWNTDTAMQVVKEHQFRRTKDSFTPISVANVYVGEVLRRHFPSMDKLTSYRVFNIAVTEAIVPLSYLFAIELGASSLVALLFTFFMSFEPNVLGHSVLAANVDGYIFVTFFLLALVAFRWSDRRDLKSMAIFALVLGLAQGVKLTSAYALPLSLLWIFYAHRKNKIPRLGMQLAVFFAVSWFGLNLIYVFNKLGTPISQIPFRSEKFQHLQRYFGWMPSIFPVDYLQGLDWVSDLEAREKRIVYIRNTIYYHGVWYYYLYTLLLKTPIPLLIASTAGWFVAVRKKLIKEKQAFVVIFAGVLFAYFSLFFNTQIGIRYLFPIYGFMLAGTIWYPWKKASIAVAVAWFVASFAYNAPNFIGYFNEFVPQKHHRWWHIGDSSLTWNQEWKDWPAQIGREGLTNEQVGPTTFPINVPFYEPAITIAGILHNHEQLEAIRDNFEPYDSWWGINLKYLITPADILKKIPVVGFEGPPFKMDCDGGGFADENGAAVPTLNLPVAPLVGLHHYTAQFHQASEGPVFLELSSKGLSSITLNGIVVLKVEEPKEPCPRLAIGTLKLPPGNYEVSVNYAKIYQDGYVSMRAYHLDGNEARLVEFCKPKAQVAKSSPEKKP